MKQNTKLFMNIYLSSLLIGPLIYYIVFHLLSADSSYYICVEIEHLDFFLNNFEFKFIYPVSCDQINYYLGFENMNNIITTDEHPYQNRPLYILFVSIVSRILNFVFVLFGININFLFQLSTFLVQLFIVSSGIYLIIKTFDVKGLNFLHLIILCFIFFLNPIVKWGIFTPSHQLLTFLVIASGLYILSSKNDLSLFWISLIFGLLFMAHRAFLIIYLLYVLKKLFLQKKRLLYILNNFKFTILFLLPYIFYTIYIRLLGYEPYDAATQYWGQFIWVYYYFINIVKHSGEWYCQTIPENFICYFKDTLKTLYYLCLPILFSVFNFQLFKKIKNCKTKKFEINLSLIVIVLFIFWSFIGWYPPLRFNLYSIGNGLILVLTMQYLYLNKLNEKIFFLASLIFYFLFLNHWNFENVIYFHPAYLLSAISMIIFSIISYRNFDSNVNEDERFL